MSSDLKMSPTSPIFLNLCTDFDFIFCLQINNHSHQESFQI